MTHCYFLLRVFIYNISSLYTDSLHFSNVYIFSISTLNYWIDIFKYTFLEWRRKPNTSKTIANPDTTPAKPYLNTHTTESRAIRKHIEPTKFATPPLGRILSNLPVQSVSDNYCYFDWEFSLRFHGEARGGARAPQLVPAHKLCISQLCTPPCKVVEFSNVGVCAVFLRRLLETPTRQWIEIRGWKSAFDRCVLG